VTHVVRKRTRHLAVHRASGFGTTTPAAWTSQQSEGTLKYYQIGYYPNSTKISTTYNDAGASRSGHTTRA
jgi:hypothetical protein